METRGLSKVSVTRKNGTSSQKLENGKESPMQNGSSSLKRPRNPQDELINTRLRSPKLTINELQGISSIFEFFWSIHQRLFVF